MLPVLSEAFASTSSSGQDTTVATGATGPTIPVRGTTTPFSQSSASERRDAIEAWVASVADSETSRRTLASLADYGCEGTTMLTTERGELEVAVRYEARPPDQYVESTELPGDSIHTELNGEEATSQSTRGSRNLEPDQVDRMYAGLHFRYLSLLWLASSGTMDASEIGEVGEDSEVEPQKSDEGNSDHGPVPMSWSVNLRGAAFTLTRADDSPRVDRLTTNGRSLRGEPVREERHFDEFQNLDGIQVPYRTTIYQNGSIAAVTRWKRCWTQP